MLFAVVSCPAGTSARRQSHQHAVFADPIGFVRLEKFDDAVP
jgi:hypothetical protein